MSSYLPHGTMRHQHALIALSLIAALSACIAGQDKNPDAKSAQKSNSASNDQKATVAKGETVTELDKAIFYIFQAKDNTYWFGSDGQGMYRYNGKTITRFTTKDGLVSNRIRGVQEDKEGAFWICNTRYRFRIDPKDAPDPGKGLIKYKRETGTGQLKAPDGTDMVYFMSITEDNKRDLWMATYGSGVWRYDGKTTTHYPIKDGAKVITLFSIYKDNRGDLWLGTHEAGAYKFNGKTFEKFRP